MSEKMLHALIGCGLFAVLLFFTSQVFNKQYAASSKKSTEPIPTMKPTDIPVECQSPYLNLNEGSKWNYIVTTTTTPSDAKQKKQKEVQHISTTLTKITTGTMLFSTVNEKTKLSSSSEIICTSSGILGLPFSFADSFFTKIVKEIEFIPSRRTYKNTEWNSTLDIGSFLPIKMQSYPVGLHFRVIEEGESVIQGKKTNTITIQSTSDAKGSIDVSSFVNITYTLGEQVGLTHANITVKVPGKADQSTEVTLRSFLNSL
jgi:hypothetical protein